MTAKPRIEPDMTDPDNPEWTREDFARAVGPDGLSDVELAAFARTKAGRPKAEHPKVPISLRVDEDVLVAFKAQGPGWQTRMNDVLRASLAPARAGRSGSRSKGR